MYIYNHLKSLWLLILLVLTFSSCEKGLLSPARNLEGAWLGTLTSSWNNANNTNMVTRDMLLSKVKVVGNTVTGTMYVYDSNGGTGGYSGDFTGYVSGVHLYYTCIIGNGCIEVHGTFTSTNLDGMKGSNPPPYICCGETLNNGNCSKGIEFHLKKL